MGLFTKQKWERTFRLRATYSAGQNMVGAMFWVWGVGGLLYNASTLFSLSRSVGVGTSAYLTATALVWIGGMVLFGLGGLILGGSFDAERPAPAEAGDVRVTR